VRSEVGDLLRKLRGLVGMAATWGAAWFAVASAVWGIALWGDLPFRVILELAGGVGIGGAMTGAAFALVLGVVERNRTFDELSYPRVALLGAVAGALVGAAVLPDLVYASLLSFFGLLIGLGAACSVLTLALARMADPDRRLAPGGAPVGLPGPE